MPEAATWWYELDADDRITAVGGAWDAFAAGNGAPRALTASVLGQSLWTFVDGLEITHLLRRILGDVRKSGTAVDVPFRCDGPATERHMHFHAAALEGGRLRVTTRLLWEASVDALPAERAPASGDAMIAMCSWCNSIRMADGAWLAAAEAAARLGLFSGARMPAITHGLCATCLVIMQPLLDVDPVAREDRRTAIS